MSLSTDLKWFLTDASWGNVARVYPAGRLPQGVTLPALTYQRISTPPEYSHDGLSKLIHPRYQLDCWAETQLEAEALAASVITAMGKWHQVFGQPAQLMDQRDGLDSETGLYRQSLDFAVWYVEA
jgi:hypothetical protein